MSFGNVAFCKTHNDNIKGNYGPVITNKKPSCLFPFLSPIIEPILRECTCHLPRIAESDTTCEYRPILALGLFFIYIFRKIWLPFSGGVYASSIVHAAEKKKIECDPNRALVRPCDLPLYADEKKCAHCVKNKSAATGSNIDDQSVLEETISCARKELWFLMDQARVVKGEVAEALSGAIERTNDGLHFLRKEENFMPRMGAIGLGGLTGFVYGLRKGMIRRLFYTTVGGGAMAALCYPREAREYSKLAYDQARMYTLLVYHFINGVSRDLTGYQLPPLPLGHFLVSDSPHPPPEAVPSAEHLLPPTVTPVHIPLPGEDEVVKHNKNQKAKDL